MNYYKHLDSLRAICISLVIWQHWFPSRITDFIKPGILGVNIFFVISGFLITEILLRNKIKVKNKELSALKYFRNFFFRRSLRIFPIYLAAIFFVLYFNVFGCSNFAIYYLTYTVNFYSYSHQAWTNFGHLWSLAVEEQFYLIWPLLIYIFPLKRTLLFIIIILSIGPLFRAISFLYLHNQFTFAHPLAAVDGFSIGAILAYIIVHTRTTLADLSVFFSRFFLLFFIGGILMMYLIFMYVNPNANGSYFNYFIPFYFTVIFLIGAYFVVKFSSGFSGKLEVLFSNNSIIFIGKISYSLYIFHNILPELVGWFGCAKLIPFNGWYKLIYLMILFATSLISWYFFERPINNLKRFF